MSGRSGGLEGREFLLALRWTVRKFGIAMADLFFEVADVASLAPGSGRSIQVRDRRLALFNVGGSFHVIDDDCPHRGGPLGPGWFDGCVVHCPLHGWAFNVVTGACDVRPDRPVRTYPAEIRGDKVWVSLTPHPVRSPVPGAET